MALLAKHNEFSIHAACWNYRLAVIPFSKLVLLRHGPLQCLIAAANSELQRLHDQAEQVKKSYQRNPLFLLKYDPRLSHILVYLVCNDAPKVAVVERVLIEQFTVPVIEDETLALQV